MIKFSTMCSRRALKWAAVQIRRGIRMKMMTINTTKLITQATLNSQYKAS